MITLDKTIQKLGDGSIVTLNTGETVFKLDSYENNPVIKPQDLGLTWLDNNELKIGAVFNGGAEIFNDKIILLPRCHQGYYKSTFYDERIGKERAALENYVSEVWALISDDGIHFNRYKNVVIKGDGTDHQDFKYGIEDIRIIKHEQGYLLVGCGKIKPPFKGYNADRVAIYSTNDFVHINYHGIISCFDSRNAVPFSEPIHDQHFILLRFHPNINIASMKAGMEQLLNPSRHIQLWEEIYESRDENLLFEAGHYPHEKEKIGPSTQVIKTDRGWLMLYHAVGELKDSLCDIYGLPEKIERGYSICAALLDIDNPGKVLCRAQNPIYIPSAPYELYGDEQYPIDVPAVVFPVGALVRGDKLIIYAGAADKYIILLSCKLDNLVNYLWEYCQ